MLKTIAAASLLTAVLAAPALAGQCPTLMNEVDAALQASAPADAQTRQQIQDLRAAGEALHTSGDHAASVEKLNQALKLLDETKG